MLTNIEYDSLSVEQKPVYDLLRDVEMSGIFETEITLIESLSFKKDRSRRFLGLAGIRKSVNRDISYPGMIHPLIDTEEGCLGLISIKEDWRDLDLFRKTKSVGRVMTNLYMINQIDGNGRTEISVDAIDMTINGAYRPISIFSESKFEPLDKDESLLLANKYLSDLTNSFVKQ
jgi:hypothetical protein